MDYNLKELREKLDEKLMGIGLDPKFKENPAYEDVLWSINSLSQDVENKEDVMVTENNGVISFEVDHHNNIEPKYSMKIWCLGNKVITDFTKEKSYFVSGELTNEKAMRRRTSTVDEIGSISLSENYTFADTLGLSQTEKKEKTNIYDSFTVRTYSPEGIEQTRENWRYFPQQLNGNFAGFKMTLNSNKDTYMTHEKIERIYLDVAKHTYHDVSKNKKYRALEVLNNQYGLREMNLQGGGISYPFEIMPISKNEVEKYIMNEKNPKVAEGLRKYANERAELYYTPEMDEEFYYEGFEEKQEKGR